MDREEEVSQVLRAMYSANVTQAVQLIDAVATELRQSLAQPMLLRTPIIQAWVGNLDRAKYLLQPQNFQDKKS